MHTIALWIGACLISLGLSMCAVELKRIANAAEKGCVIKETKPAKRVTV